IAEGGQFFFRNLSPGDKAIGSRVDMDADNMIWIEPAHLRRNKRAKVAPLRAIARVPQAAHQFDKGGRDACAVPTGVRDGAGETKVWHRRDDEEKGVAGVAAVAGRIGQRADHVKELDDRTGP